MHRHAEVNTHAKDPGSLKVQDALDVSDELQFAEFELEESLVATLLEDRFGICSCE